MNIFEGKSVSSIESDLEKALEDINQQVEIAHRQNEELQKDWIASKQQQAILENNWKQAKTRCAQLDQKIIDWIDYYNQQNNAADQIPLDRDQVDHLLSYTEQWMEDQLEKIKLADQQVITAKSKLEQRDRDLQKHRATTGDQRSLEDLLALQLSKGSQLEQHQMAVMERQLRIENNQKNLKKQGQVQKQIEQQLQKYEGWAALNGLIGSRDGRRFREIAQQYTLDLLLGYANKHLYVLSKRYVLSRIPDSLAIQVIDQDMADELRSVYSLSGGESFLVSLALALGLASLSSRRLKVESLFIDEGFGSLDPTTLSVAMDALERLKDQGRKVGVISHVQEMTERIAVQIQVHKKPSGKSNISVESLA
jgi:exonuclease SbcC